MKAILHDPELLVLDEPTASLDPDVAYRVRTGLLDVAANDGTALLVTSHNMAGKVVADGSPSEVADAFGHGVVQPIAKVLPTTYAFSAARDLLDGGGVPWADLGWATLGAFVLAGLSMLYVLRMLRIFRTRGFVTRYS